MDEFTTVTGYHRKAAIRMMSRSPKKESGHAVAALKEVWEASDRIWSRRLQPFLPELVEALERHGELKVTAAVREHLCRISAATIDRPLKPLLRWGLRGF